MSRRGRKRKGGIPRAPSGALSRSAYAQLARGEREVALSQPHRRWLPEEVRVDQRAGDLLGCLRLADAITEAEYWAGQRYRRIMAEFRVVLASPAVPPGVIARIASPAVSTDYAEAGLLRAVEREGEEARSARVIREHREMMDVLIEAAGPRRGLGAFDAMLCRDIGCGEGKWPAMRGLLKALVVAWKLDDAPRAITGAITERASWAREEHEVPVEYVEAGCLPIE